MTIRELPPGFAQLMGAKRPGYFAYKPQPLEPPAFALARASVPGNLCCAGGPKARRWRLGSRTPIAQPCADLIAEQTHVTAATIALLAAFLTCGGGMVGLLYDKLLPEHQVSDETRALINRVTGLVATMSALVLGLLIASANTFYNSQKSGLEILSERIIELDSMLRDYGPDPQPIRDPLKATVTRVYQHTWNS